MSRPLWKGNAQPDQTSRHPGTGFTATLQNGRYVGGRKWFGYPLGNVHRFGLLRIVLAVVFPGELIFVVSFLVIDFINPDRALFQPVLSGRNFQFLRVGYGTIRISHD